MKFSEKNPNIIIILGITILLLCILSLKLFIPHEDAAITLDIAKNLSERNIFTYWEFKYSHRGISGFFMGVTYIIFYKTRF